VNEQRGEDTGPESLAERVVAALPDLVNTFIHLNGLIADRMHVVPSDFQCLHVIAGDGPTTASVIAERVALTPGSVSRAIDRLEAAACVRRIPDPGDRRRTLLEATPEGLQRINGYYKGLTARTRDDLAALSESELATVLRFVNAAKHGAEAEARRLRES
jgi:DNA-binding MarR family transcriptional regulator